MYQGGGWPPTVKGTHLGPFSNNWHTLGTAPIMTHPMSQSQNGPQKREWTWDSEGPDNIQTNTDSRVPRLSRHYLIGWKCRGPKVFQGDAAVPAAMKHSSTTSSCSMTGNRQFQKNYLCGAKKQSLDPSWRKNSLDQQLSEHVTLAT